jgi:hypothetical protein
VSSRGTASTLGITRDTRLGRCLWNIPRADKATNNALRESRLSSRRLVAERSVRRPLCDYRTVTSPDIDVTSRTKGRLFDASYRQAINQRVSGCRTSHFGGDRNGKRTRRPGDSRTQSAPERQLHQGKRRGDSRQPSRLESELFGHEKGLLHGRGRTKDRAFSRPVLIRSLRGGERGAAAAAAMQAISDLRGLIVHRERIIGIRSRGRNS